MNAELADQNTEPNQLIQKDPRASA